MAVHSERARVNGFWRALTWRHALLHVPRLRCAACAVLSASSPACCPTCSTVSRAGRAARGSSGRPALPPSLQRAAAVANGTTEDAELDVC
jgi:hypothetical protein